MHLHIHENKKFNKTVYDDVREFCLCERTNEEYIRALIKENNYSNVNSAGNQMPGTESKTGKSHHKSLLYGLMILLLFIFQSLAGKAGRTIANLFSYETVDYYNAFAWVSVHHIIQMFIAVAVVIVLSRMLKVDFGFSLGDRKKGIELVVKFTAIFTVVTLVCHILMLIYNMLPAYDFPLNKNNILGTLGFQLLLSGTEEILYRAIPTTIFVLVLGKSVNIKWGITLETVIASVLFSIAHMKWSLFPFTVDVNYFRVFYAFVLGTIMGKAYQESHSIVYPMFMHSISNVLMVGTGYLFILLQM